MSTTPASPAGPVDPLLRQILHETYVVEKLLGAGGMGAVYKARHQRLPNKFFAIKVLHAAMAQNADVFGRFRREAEITSSLQHPHIVQVMDFNQIPGGAYYLVMELLNGEDLSARLARFGRLPLPEALVVAHQVGSALQAAHDSGVVHRDLKPQNIFLVRNTELGRSIDSVKVVDFGISKIRNPDIGMGPATTDGTLLGTPSYMSPEQAAGRVKDIDGRTDQYALGAIVYEMLSGRVAFMPEGEEGLTGVLIRVVTQPAPSLQLLCPDLPLHVLQAVSRAMAKNPAERFPSVMEFLRALGALEVQSGPSVVTTAGMSSVSAAPLGGSLAGVTAAGAPGGMFASGLMAHGPSGLLGGPTAAPGSAAELFAGTRQHRPAGPSQISSPGGATQLLPGGGAGGNSGEADSAASGSKPGSLGMGTGPDAATQMLPGAAASLGPSGTQVLPPGASEAVAARPGGAGGTALLPPQGGGTALLPPQGGSLGQATVAMGSQGLTPTYGSGIRAGADVGGGMTRVLIYGAVAGVGGLILLLLLVFKLFAR